MIQNAPLSWSSFFDAGELGTLRLGFALPDLVLADSRETIFLDSYDGRPASAWAGCAIDPERVPSIAFRGDYFSVGRGANERPRRLLLHELSHVAGNSGHQFSFAATLKLMFLRHSRRNCGEHFSLRDYDVHQDPRPAAEAMHFAGAAAELFVDDKRTIFELVPEFWRIQYRADRVGFPAALPRPRRRFFFF